jgi:hypothetical protein
MQWDLGFQALALLAAMCVGFGVAAALLVGRGAAYRTLAGAVTAVACFCVGLVTSEVMFGWATEEELQPNIDGLSRDEVLLSSVVTTVLVVVVMRHLARRSAQQTSHPHGGVLRHGRHRQA